MRTNPCLVLLLLLLLTGACDDSAKVCLLRQVDKNVALVVLDACESGAMCPDQIELRDGLDRVLSEQILDSRCGGRPGGQLSVGDYHVKTTKAGYRDQITPFSVREDECGERTTASVVYATMTPIDGCPQK